MQQVYEWNQQHGFDGQGIFFNSNVGCVGFSSFFFLECCIIFFPRIIWFMFLSIVDSILWGSLMRSREAAGNVLMDTTCVEENLNQNPFTWVLRNFCPIIKVLDSCPSSKKTICLLSLIVIWIGLFFLLFSLKPRMKLNYTVLHFLFSYTISISKLLSFLRSFCSSLNHLEKSVIDLACLGCPFISTMSIFKVLLSFKLRLLTNFSWYF